MKILIWTVAGISWFAVCGVFGWEVLGPFFEHFIGLIDALSRH